MRTVDIGRVNVLRETPKARLLEVTDCRREEYWIPKSAHELREDPMYGTCASIAPWLYWREMHTDAKNSGF